MGQNKQSTLFFLYPGNARACLGINTPMLRTKPRAKSTKFDKFSRDKQTIKKMCIDLMCMASFNKKSHNDTQKKMMWVCHIHHGYKFQVFLLTDCDKNSHTRHM